MKKTKLLATALLAGFVLQQSALSQPGGSLAATNSEVYDAMVSNAVKFSTSSEEPSGTAVTTVVTNQTVTTIVSNEPSSATIIVSNPPVSSAVSNEPSPSMAVTTVATNQTVTTTVSNEPSPVTTISNVTMAPA